MHNHAFADIVGWIDDYGLTLRQAREHFDLLAIVAAKFDFAEMHFPIGPYHSHLRPVGANHERVTRYHGRRIGAGCGTACTVGEQRVQ